MPLKVAAIVKDAENVNQTLAFPAEIDDEVPRVLHNSKRATRPFATETLLPSPSLQPLLRDD